MDSLDVRKIKFNLEGVNFIWNESNPEFSVFINHLSFWLVALEKYFCKAVQEAKPLIQDADLEREAGLFTLQEAQHSMAHREHVKALVKQYPELKNTLKKVVLFYDELFEQQPLKYHLAYLAGEAAFAPFFTMYINNQNRLFKHGDARVSSLCLWHFFEEIEHRSTGLAIYNHVVRSWWYRIKELPGMIHHITQCFDIIGEDFKRLIPQVDWGDSHVLPDPFSGISLSSRIKYMTGVFLTLTPWHNPEKSRVPDWNKEWLKHYKQGDDMSQHYGKLLSK